MECKFNPCPSVQSNSSDTTTDSSSAADFFPLGGGQLDESMETSSQKLIKQPSSSSRTSAAVGKCFFVSRVNPNPQEQNANDSTETTKSGLNVENPTEIGQIDGGEELISFRYTWPVRISERLIGADESAILNVSPPFCTAHNGVQFTWLLRICEENILDFGRPTIDGSGTISSQNQLQLDSDGFGDDDNIDAELFGRKKVNITLYYKEGPARDVKLHAGNITIRNAKGILFNNLPLRDLEYTKGGGWSPICCSSSMSQQIDVDDCQHRKFSQFIHEHVGKQITVRVKLEMPVSLFQPMQYLPSIDSPFSGKLEKICAKVLDQIHTNQLAVPDMEFFDHKTDKYALYRHVYQFACEEIFQQFNQENNETGNCCDQGPELMDKIKNVFAHYYFNTVIVPEAECFEDFLDALDASTYVQFPALRRECERYICSEIMAESADLTLVKKMLLLAERFNLPVLKMVSFGVIIDLILMQQKEENITTVESTNSSENQLAGANSQPHSPLSTQSRKSMDSGGNGTTIESSMEEIREELLEIAEQIIHPDHPQSHNLSSPSPSNPLKNSGADNAQNSALGFRRVHSKSLCHPTIGGDGKLGLSSASNSEVEEEEFIGKEDDEEEEAESDPGGETLVGSVIAQLEELARHIRKVSMPPGVRPAPLQQQNADRLSSPTSELAQNIMTPKSIFHQNSCGPAACGGMDSGNGSSILMDSRRSSLKTGRDQILHLQQLHRQERSGDSTGSGHSLDDEVNFDTPPPPFFAQLYCQHPTNKKMIESRPASSCDYIPEQKFATKNCASKKVVHHPKFAVIPTKIHFASSIGGNEENLEQFDGFCQQQPIQRKNAVAAFQQNKLEMGQHKNEQDEGVEEDANAKD